MKHFLRPLQEIGIGIGCVVLAGAGLAMYAPGAHAQATQIIDLLQEPNPLLGHTGPSQGYLGVDLADVDQEKAQTLKLKEVRGAVITLIDHDAPAGQIGLKINDVVIQLNGQNVEGAEQLRRMLKEIPAGRKVSIEIVRDGNIQTMAVQLADRRIMEQEVWNKIGNGGDVFAQPGGMGILAGSGDAPLPGGFHMPFFGSTLNVGAMVEPLTSQMAEYLGVASGLMVKQVAHKSEAETAGLKAFDVILKVGNEPITNMAGWDRELRSNQGKPVQVTILRDRKQQTLTLQVDSKHHGELEWEQMFPGEDGQMVAEIDQKCGLAFDGSEAAEQLSEQAQALEDSMQNFKFSQKQLDEMKRQMEEFRKNFKPEDFNPNPQQPNSQQMEQFKLQMNQFQKQPLELNTDGRGATV